MKNEHSFKKGYIRKEEWNQKQRLKMTGRKSSHAHKMKISEGLKKAYKEGRRKPIMTEEIREKIRLSHIGQVPWNKGLKTNKIPWNKGKKGMIQSKISNEKRSITMKKWHKENRNTKKYLEKILKASSKKIGSKFPKDKYPLYGIRKIRKSLILPLKDSSIEVKIQNFLKQLGIEYFTHQYMNIEHGYQCDILIPSINLVIECDGDYWHKFPIGRDIDNIRTKELLDKGFKVLRLWECDIKKMDITQLKQNIMRFNNE